MRNILSTSAPDGSAQYPEMEVEAAPRENSLRRRRGATALEYLFVISLILTVAMTGIGYFGKSTKDTTQKASDAIENATKSH
jgi:transposase